MLRACLSQSCKACDLDSQPRRLLALLLMPAHVAPVAGVADPPNPLPQIPVGSLPRAHLLHAYAQAKYHGCTRYDMMIINK
jgi:hypothetical protein